MSDKLLVTWGSSRQARELAEAYELRGHGHMHIEDHELAERPAEVRARVVARCAEVRESHWVNLGRASRKDAVRNIAATWETLIPEAPCEVRPFGPTRHASQVFDDKWKTYQLLTQHGINAVESRLTTAAELQDDDSPRRVVAKLLDRTGGVGIVAGYSAGECGKELVSRFGAGQSVLLSDFVDGYEASVKLAVAEEQVLPVALILKERTSIPVVHGDWKIKVAVPLTRPSAMFNIAEQVAEASRTRGFLSVEGVIDSNSREFRVTEVANRRTGSFIISDAVSASGRAADVIPELLGLAGHGGGRRRHSEAATVAFESSPRSHEVVEALNASGLVIGIDRENLGELPGSGDGRHRIRVHLHSGHGGPKITEVVHRTLGSAAAATIAELFEQARIHNF
ncbi:ATP-grasp domain-containing protein [Streptomyces parvus]|uniref:ATP-grasp domain-containing protein n=1 Tax=Streptomyces parvus TaxID=66428 RepID=A0A7K3RWJ7_9ACTN|nr:ATP-grasp domain-containing protein [Streptomyces parvus]NEC19615.1 ATP-grasp domain-containing protein [Streptomyces parvus]